MLIIFRSIGQGQTGVYDNKEGLGIKDYHRKVFQEGEGVDRIGIITRNESIYSNTKKESANQNPDLVYTQDGVYDNPGQLTGMPSSVCVCSYNHILHCFCLMHSGVVPLLLFCLLHTLYLSYICIFHICNT